MRNTQNWAQRLAGEISDGPDGPTITCKFHNSKFKLETGEATQWTTGVMGMENAMIGNIMGKVCAHLVNARNTS